MEKTIITESGRCSWGKCIFCSFSKKPNPPEVSFERLKEEADQALANGVKRLKYFNSGSFLDEKQIPKKFRDYLIERCAHYGIGELVVECHPKHITRKALDEIPRIAGLQITFAVGLEAADDAVLEKINKGFTVKEYEKTARLLKQCGFGVRTYIMANLPFVDNPNGCLEKSVDFALKLSDSVAVINTYPYGYSPLFKMWVDEMWAPLDRHQFEEACKKYKKNSKVELFFDDYVTYPKFPDFMKHKINGATSACLNHPHFNAWQEYLGRFYEKPDVKKYALFLPCAYRKPYSRSQTHKKILERLNGIAGYQKIHQIMISTPGVIPREFETKYPFESYDWPEWEETEEIKKEYITITKNRVKKYLEKHRYEKVFAYFKKESESFAALAIACRELKIELISLLDEKMYKEIKHISSGKAPNSVLTLRPLLDSFSTKLRAELP